MKWKIPENINIKAKRSIFFCSFILGAMSCHLGRGFAGTASTIGGVRDSETHFSGNAAHYKKVEILAKLNINLGCLACFYHFTPRPTHTRGNGKVLLAIYKKNYFRPLISEEYGAQQRSPVIGFAGLGG